MNKEHVLAAAGSLAFHGLCVAGLVLWQTDVLPQPAAAQDPEAERQPSSLVMAPPDSARDSTGGNAGGLLDSSLSARRNPAALADSSPKTLAETVSVKPPRKLVPTVAAKTPPIVEGSYSWPEGEKRKKVSGPLPKPLNVGKLPEEVSLDLAVSPNGTVHSIKVVDPSGSGFEREAVRVLRRWRFEVLPRSKPQREQRCTVTLRVTR